MINDPVSNGKQILIVEDDRAIAEMLSMLLELEGYTPTIVTSGPDALAQLMPSTRASNGHAASAAEHRSGHAVVLLDLQLPGMSGEDLIEQLATTDQAPPIIVLSAKREQDLEAVAAMPGVTAVLAKPFDIEELLQHITAVTTREC